jgi:hypothetical protein
VFFTVYTLKRKGVRLSKQDALATVRIGQLIYRLRRPVGAPVQEAVLLDERGVEGQILHSAEVRKMDADGILLRGYVTDHSVATQKSAEVWWCVYRPGGPLILCQGPQLERMPPEDARAPEDPLAT